MTNEKKSELISFHSDFHKDAYGIRPRCYDYTDWTEQDFQNEFDKLGRIIDENLAQEKAQYNANIKAFEELIEKTIAMGANDRETALRWLLEGSDCEFDVEYFMYLNGFSVYSDYGKKMLSEINQVIKTLQKELA
jgi:hypothetical protein